VLLLFASLSDYFLKSESSADTPQINAKFHWVRRVTSPDPRRTNRGVGRSLSGQEIARCAGTNNKEQLVRFFSSHFSKILILKHLLREIGKYHGKILSRKDL